MEKKLKLVISTGAGMSAESGISTFRDSGGLWEQYNVMDVASADGFARNPKLIHDFYNARRKELVKAHPNAGHRGLVDLEKDFDVYVITQNVDNLHERAGSSNVTHLHGELMKVRTINPPYHIYELSEDNLETSPESRDADGCPIRPHIVFFQEDVPEFSKAVEIVEEADIFVVIGTSLSVYPAAALLNYVRRGVPIYYIDPRPVAVPSYVHVIAKPASKGVAELAAILRKQYVEK